MKFVYWKIHARATPAMLMLSAAGLPFEWDDATANAWPATKGSTPFGQLPVLYDGDLLLAQSGAINRYCAKKAGL